ncbi:MAG: hypothetical protein WD875_01815, partial [Pirellulales bacterium]
NDQTPEPPPSIQLSTADGAVSCYGDAAAFGGGVSCVQTGANCAAGRRLRWHDCGHFFEKVGTIVGTLHRLPASPLYAVRKKHGTIYASSDTARQYLDPTQNSSCLPFYLLSGDDKRWQEDVSYVASMSQIARPSGQSVLLRAYRDNCEGPANTAAIATLRHGGSVATVGAGYVPGAGLVAATFRDAATIQAGGTGDDDYHFNLLMSAL